MSSQTAQPLAQRATYADASWIFLRLLGVVFLFAFWSLALQTQGLIGHDGILPVGEYMADARVWADANSVGIGRYRLLPTIFWFGTSDAFLSATTWTGVILSLLQIAGIGSVAVLPAMWLLFLSLNVAGRDFLSFQWDALLLETGLLAVAVTPWRWWHRRGDHIDPPAIGRWLLWLLVFRLMFASGFVKLASGDATWRGLTALAVHYETQPLPTVIAWVASQLPLWFQRLSTAATLAIELAVPWFIFAGRRMRHAAAFVLIVLQVLIAATGNYAFFNLLAAVLFVTLLDDEQIRTLRQMGKRAVVTPASMTELATAVALAVVTLPVSLSLFGAQLRIVSPAPFVRPLVDLLDPLRSINTYGLFAIMTTSRPEIIVEGSMDGQTWRAYEFRYKPGDVSKPPRWVAPFQPRLDWQMWFAALGRYEEEAWYHAFCQRLLDGSPSVLALLETNPFPGKPPRFVRSTLYRYRYAPRGSRTWWLREPLRPVLTGAQRSSFHASILIRPRMAEPPLPSGLTTTVSPSSTAPHSGNARDRLGMCVTTTALPRAGTCVMRVRSQLLCASVAACMLRPPSPSSATMVGIPSCASRTV